MSTTALPDQLSETARAFAGAAHGLLIDGERVEALDGRTFETIDPATEQPITTVARAGAQDVDRAVRAARRAFDEGAWPRLAAAERARLINRFAELIDGAGEELAQL